MLADCKPVMPMFLAILNDILSLCLNFYPPRPRQARTVFVISDDEVVSGNSKDIQGLDQYWLCLVFEFDCVACQTPSCRLSRISLPSSPETTIGTTWPRILFLLLLRWKFANIKRFNHHQRAITFGSSRTYLPLKPLANSMVLCDHCKSRYRSCRGR